jgi:hypothetical protein
MLCVLVAAQIIGKFYDYAIFSGRGEIGRANDALDSGVKQLIIDFVILSAATFVACYGQMSLWMITAERQASVRRADAAPDMPSCRGC